MKSAYGDYFDGIRAMLPLLPGAVPFGMIAGAVAAEAGFGTAAGIGQSVVIYAGAAQLAATQLVAVAAPALIIVLTGLVVNLRFAMYSASLASHFTGLSLRHRALLAYLMTDQSYALTVARYGAAGSADSAAKARFYLGGAVAMWIVWLSATAAGFLLGSRVPPSWSLDFFVPLSFLALLVPGIRDRATAAAAATGAAVAVIAAGLVFNLGLFVAAACGIAAGYLVETRYAARGERK
ncbi:AzlC family ABC transporter permease [uncultured Parvibaculum sp.]|uniref:AzlC family ABC transporter permease n=1 Tax=uncultured Parvibaculum sp. TaxID=291828 RepID=UPI0030DCA792|tara:strand:+ start:24163 stop:24873 length:711 start_codon:yes stop_codon:yes gene_type:complete